MHWSQPAFCPAGAGSSQGQPGWNSSVVQIFRSDCTALKGHHESRSSKAALLYRLVPHRSSSSNTTTYISHTNSQETNAACLSGGHSAFYGL